MKGQRELILPYHPVRRETALAFDAPWKGGSSGHVTVFKDTDGYRMYYRDSQWQPVKQENTCVALSRGLGGGVRPSRGKLAFRRVYARGADEVSRRVGRKQVSGRHFHPHETGRNIVPGRWSGQTR